MNKRPTPHHEPLRVGVIGGGLIAQAVHLPNLAANSSTQITAFADPSLGVCEGISNRYAIPSTYRDWRSMLSGEHLDAVVVCSPHSTHAEIVLAAIEQGVHVLVEKPLCIDPADAELIDRRSREANVVVQVGYMKRYDPAYDLFVHDLPADSRELRLIDVLTFDPWMSRAPYVDWDGFVRADDVPADLLARFRAEEAEQVGRAVGNDDPATVRAYSYTFLACLVHDVNLVNGVLDRWNLSALPAHSCSWADGGAATAMLELGNGARWRSTWLLLPKQNAFRESVRIYFSDSIHELQFSTPYHSQIATVHKVHSGLGSSGVQERTSSIVEDSYVNELQAFVAVVRDGAPNLTPPKQATRDLELLRELFTRRPT